MLAKKLQHDAGVSQGVCGIEEIETFQGVFEKITRFFVVSRQDYHGFNIKKKPEVPKKNLFIFT